MEIIQQFFSDAVMRALGWTVLHSLWQGVLIAAMLGVFLHLGRKLDSRAKYFAAITALLSCLVLPVITFSTLYNPVAASSETFTVGEALLSLSGSSTQSYSQLEAYLPMIANIWFVGFLILFLRTLGGYVVLNRLRSSAIPVNEGVLLDAFESIYQRSGVQRAVRLLHSHKVSSPSVVGYFRPVIIIPFGMINQLSYDQAEAILSHEFAHVMRHDFIVNIIQSFIEAVLYFNPAVWWISSQIRSLREQCCDDIAVRMSGGNQFEYVRSLILVQEMATRTPNSNKLALAFSGTGGRMLDRVRHILQQPQKNVFAMEKLIFSGLLVILFITASAFNKSTEDPSEKFMVELEETASSNYIALDSVPKKSRVIKESVTITEGGKQYQAIYKNGELTELKVDGKDIPKEAHDNYVDILNDLRNEIDPVENDEEDKIMLEGGISIKSNNSEEDVFEVQIGDEDLRTIRIESVKQGDGSNRISVYSGDDDEPTTVDVRGENIIRLMGDEVRWEDGTITITSDEGDREIEIPNYNLFFSEEGGSYKYNFDDEKHIIVQGFKRSDMEFEDLEVQKAIEKAMQETGRALERMEIELDQEDLNEEEREAFKRAMESLELQEHEIKVMEQRIERELEGNIQRQMEKALRELEREQRQLERQQREMEREQRVIIRSAPQVPPPPPPVPDFQTLVENELLKDGLIESSADYTLKLQHGKMKVNGKRQSQEIYEKYSALWERISGASIEEASFTVKKKD